MSKRILVAALLHETHGFVDGTTGLDDFRRLHGQQVLARLGDGSLVDGLLSVCAARGWQVVPSADWAALPAGPVEHAVFSAFRDTVVADLKAALAEGKLHGILLSLHGAMTTTASSDAEGDLLAALRAVPGAADLPIFGVFDLHATFTDAMARHADALVGYRYNPHTDARESAVRVAELMARCLDVGRRPRIAWRRVPVIWPPTGTGTADSPMRELEARARAMEAADPRIWAVSVVAGFAFADAPEAGVSVAMVHDGADESALDGLAALAWELRAEGLPEEHGLDDAVRAAIAAPRGPVLLVEPADNIGGGGPGDCTDVLRALLRHDAQGAAVAIADPVSVAALRDVPVGGTARIAVGGRGWRADAGPVEMEVTLVSRSDGRFRLEDLNSHQVAAGGADIRMGESVVVRHRGLTLLLNSRKCPPMDLGQWRSQGQPPEQFRIIIIKAAVAHRRAYDPIAAASYTVRSRGPCGSDLSAVPYRRLQRPVYPLDDVPR